MAIDVAWNSVGSSIDGPMPLNSSTKVWMQHYLENLSRHNWERLVVLERSLQMELEPLGGTCRVLHTQYHDTLQKTINKPSINTDLICPVYVLGIGHSEPAGFHSVAPNTAELRFGCDCEIEALARTKHIRRTDKLREMR